MFHRGIEEQRQVNDNRFYFILVFYFPLHVFHLKMTIQLPKEIGNDMRLNKC